MASGNTIWLDDNAAGYGWFIDATPIDSAEFDNGIGHGPSAGKVDLLTVLTHELGHLVGRDELFGDTDDVMGIALPLGTRRLPVADTEVRLDVLRGPTPIPSDRAPLQLLDQILADRATGSDTLRDKKKWQAPISQPIIPPFRQRRLGDALAMAHRDMNQLVNNADEEIAIERMTDHDANDIAVESILAEWESL